MIEPIHLSRRWKLERKQARRALRLYSRICRRLKKNSYAKPKPTFVAKKELLKCYHRPWMVEIVCALGEGLSPERLSQSTKNTLADLDIKLKFLKV